MLRAPLRLAHALLLLAGCSRSPIAAFPPATPTCLPSPSATIACPLGAYHPIAQPWVCVFPTSGPRATPSASPSPTRIPFPTKLPLPQGSLVAQLQEFRGLYLTYNHSDWAVVSDSPIAGLLLMSLRIPSCTVHESSGTEVCGYGEDVHIRKRSLAGDGGLAFTVIHCLTVKLQDSVYILEEGLDNYAYPDGSPSFELSVDDDYIGPCRSSADNLLLSLRVGE